MSVRELHSMPNLTLLYGKAAFTSTSRDGGRLPDVELILRDTEVNRVQLEDYERVCGFRVSDELPATYPHVLTFPLAVQLMSDPAFPFPLPGLLHIGNRITQYRPLDASEPLTLRVGAGELAPHERGTQFDVLSEVRVRDEIVWTERSTYLRRSGGSGPAASSAASGSSGASVRTAPAAAPETTAVWRVPGDLGRRYAAVSGDRNPIHLHPLSARLFGFSRPIAHGMWTKARCLAAFEGRLPDRFTVDVQFQRPIRLPATVRFASQPGVESWGFGVYRSGSGKPHLTGSFGAVGR